MRIISTNKITEIAIISMLLPLGRGRVGNKPYISPKLIKARQNMTILEETKTPLPLTTKVDSKTITGNAIMAVS